MKTKRACQEARRWYQPGDRTLLTLPTTRKVTGKTAKLYLHVAELCEKDAANFDALAKQARSFQEQCEQCGSADFHWKNEVEKREREAEAMREKAATYRRLAGK